MALILQNYWIELGILITALLLIVRNYCNKSYQYWEKKGVPYIKPRFPLGSNTALFPRRFSVGALSKNFYDQLKKDGHKFGGLYLLATPNLLIMDPDYLKDVMSKDFDHFVDRGVYHNAKDDPISAHLFSVDDDKWRNLRIKLTPTFTSGKMKIMFHSVIQCSDYMTKHLEENVGVDLDIKDICGRFTTDVIGTCAFGVTCNSFKYPNAEFRMMGINIFANNYFQKFKFFLLLNLPQLSLKLHLGSTKASVSKFFTELVKDTLKMREESTSKRNDFLQLLMEMKQSANFSLNEIIAQVFLFFVAGFDTSSTAMAFTLYELARNPSIQSKLRQEINEVLEKYNGEITYESLSEIKYLDQVLDEGLRMYPPLTTLLRRCTKDYNLRNTNIVIERGTPILISALGLHMDPEYFPNPDVFDPERFSKENKKNIQPFTYLPFGDGPRNCIGLRFGVMQSKIGLIKFIKNFQVTVSPKTKPVKFDDYGFLLNSVNPVYLTAEKL